MDCWTIISNLSAITSKIRLGPVITYLFPKYRNIALLAKQAVTFQEMSQGRLAFRTGAGATLQYASQWWHPFGIDYPTIKDDSLIFLRKEFRFFKNSGTALQVLSFYGDYFKVNGGTLAKTNTPIPITVAAKGEKMMGIAGIRGCMGSILYLA